MVIKRHRSYPRSVECHRGSCCACWSYTVGRSILAAANDLAIEYHGMPVDPIFGQYYDELLVEYQDDEVHMPQLTRAIGHRYLRKELNVNVSYGICRLCKDSFAKTE